MDREAEAGMQWVFVRTYCLHHSSFRTNERPCGSQSDRGFARYVLSALLKCKSKHKQFYEPVQHTNPVKVIPLRFLISAFTTQAKNVNFSSREWKDEREIRRGTQTKPQAGELKKG